MGNPPQNIENSKSNIGSLRIIGYTICTRRILSGASLCIIKPK